MKNSLETPPDPLPGIAREDGPDGIVSVIMPVFNERGNLAPLLAEISDALASVPHEVIAVDDGSTDGSLAELGGLTRRFPRLRVLAREHAGQSAALIAGFEQATGSIIVTLDADGQNDPADIPLLLDVLGDCGEPRAVVGVRARRAAGRWKRVQAHIANRVRDLITGDRVLDTGCALRVARAKDLQKLPRFAGMHRFIPTLLRREGVTVLERPVRDRPRRHGRSKYGMRNRVFKGLVDAIGVRWLLRRQLPNSLHRADKEDYKRGGASSTFHAAPSTPNQNGQSDDCLHAENR